MEQHFQTPGEYVLRTGSARADLPPKPIKISGILSAPFDFLIGKSVLDITCHMLIYKNLGKLELHIGDTDPNSEQVITGSLTRDGALDMFGINTENRWTVQEFLKFLKTVSYHFPDKTQHKKLIDSLQTWSAKIQTVLREAQDTKGNTSFQLERKVSEVDLLNKFTIEVPIFQGYPKQKFDVEIGLDPKALSVDLYLISDDLYEIEATHREKILDQELEKYANHHFSKVIVS